MLRHKQVTGMNLPVEMTRDIYMLGLNTLKALMYLLRLQKEWDTITRVQYELDLEFDWVHSMTKQVDSDQCIKLLVRCTKMYEAKS